VFGAWDRAARRGVPQFLRKPAQVAHDVRDSLHGLNTFHHRSFSPGVQRTWHDFCSAPFASCPSDTS
jgi:hypothetical protein